MLLFTAECKQALAEPLLTKKRRARGVVVQLKQPDRLVRGLLLMLVRLRNTVREADFEPKPISLRMQSAASDIFKPGESQGVNGSGEKARTG